MQGLLELVGSAAGRPGRRGALSTKGEPVRPTISRRQHDIGGTVKHVGADQPQIVQPVQPGAFAQHDLGDLRRSRPPGAAAKG